MVKISILSSCTTIRFYTGIGVFKARCFNGKGDSNVFVFSILFLRLQAAFATRNFISANACEPCENADTCHSFRLNEGRVFRGEKQ